MTGLAGIGTEEHIRLARPFQVIAFDWDGTAVMGRKEDASAVNELLDRLLADGVLIVVITGTNLTNTTNQLSGVIHGQNNRGLYIATNRGSEVFGFDGGPQPVLKWKRKASEQEERLLTTSADRVRDILADRGLQAHVVYDRLNRRKIDIIPLPEWADPPKWAIGNLLDAVLARLGRAGLTGGLDEVLRLAENIGREVGLEDPRVTSDVKHVEIGLTDKSDSIAWMCRELCRKKRIAVDDVLIAGDEFGPIGGVEGSDHKMVTEHSQGAVFVSVGPEPGGAPEPVIHLGGGPERFRALLQAQLELREARPVARPPAPELPTSRTTDPGWLLVRQGIDLAREREIESLMAIANGYVGTRGSLAEGTPAHSSPATFIAGVFDTLPQASAVPELAVAPDWTQVRILVAGHEAHLAPGTFVEHRRSLDMRQGIVWREWRHRDPSGRITELRGLRLAAQHDRRLLFQSVAITPENYTGKLIVEAVIEPPRLTVAGIQVHRPTLLPAFEPSAREAHEPAVLLYRTSSTNVLVAIAAAHLLEGPDGPLEQGPSERRAGLLVKRWELSVDIGETYRLDRIVALHTSRDGGDPVREALERAREAGLGDGRRLVRRHKRSWQRRWQAVDIEIEGDDEAQRSLRFAAYHLISAANPEDERVSIAARTLSGDAYKGHVFWDTDIFILPFFTFTDPPSTRAMLMYRWHTLPAAREKARSMGYRGALYAWESADTGEETTPRFMRAPDGEMVRIVTGEQEHHISADVAYAVWQYWAASGDDEFLWAHGAEMLLETARFWSTRGRLEEDGRYHIRKVVGPDEYHEGVDDNAFTNLMAGWNLERGLEVARMMAERRPEAWASLRERLELRDEELERWAQLAGAMYVAYDEASGLIEQFAGFHRLEEFDLRPLRRQGKRGLPLDLLLGRERTVKTKIIKQADVVMALHLLWDRFDARTRGANFDYYEPRTCHGSSLSPATHAVVAARLGETAVAEAYFIQAARIDLANNMGNAAGGVHAAALGGLWQAAVFGFAGMQLKAEGLLFDPHLPLRWQALRFPVKYRGVGLRVEIRQDPLLFRARVEGPGSAFVKLEGGEAKELSAGRDYVSLGSEAGWGPWEEQQPPEQG